MVRSRAGLQWNLSKRILVQSNADSPERMKTRKIARLAIPLILLACTASASAENDHEPLADAARRSTFLNALAVGLDIRYGCRNFDAESSGNAISIDGYDRLAGTADDSDAGSVTLSVECVGGPTARTRSNGANNRFYEPTDWIDIDHAVSLDDYVDSGIDRKDHLHRLVIADPFIRVVYPTVTRLLEADCDALDTGEFLNRWPYEALYPLERDRVFYALTCHTSSAVHIFEFAGLYNRDDDAIDWYSIRKGWIGY